MREIVAPTLRPLVINDPEDASLKWTGEKPTNASATIGGTDQVQPVVSTKKRRRSAEKKRRRSAESFNRKHEQKSIAIKNEEQAEELMRVLDLDRTAVVNLGLAALAKQWL